MDLIDPAALPLSQLLPDGTTEARRPKLLFLAWNFPPVQAIASVRTWNAAKYLTRLGWDVTVVTPKPELWRHLGNPEKAMAAFATEGIRQILTDHDWRFLSPIHLTCWNQHLGWLAGGMCRTIARRVGIDEGVGWIEAAERACDKLNPNDVDLILASGPPFAGFILAERLSKTLARPYVLDYRDPWTKGPDTIQALRPMVARLEARLLAGAGAVTIVSPSWGSDLDRRYKVGSKLHVVTNGYDPEEIMEVTPHDFGHFAIVYAGLFFAPERVVTPLFAALRELVGKSGREWCFHYYGDHNDHVRQEAVSLGILDRVRLHGRVPRSEALSAIRGANIAVVITSVLEEASTKINGWVPAKLFDIMGLGASMLLIAPPGTDVESIAVSAGTAHRLSGQDIGGIRSFVEQIMSGTTIEKMNTDRFSWINIGKQFDSHLRSQLPKQLSHPAWNHESENHLRKRS
jgi:glycosyltransferase involved in cell wall biosynthesis